jgi:hypothetical protein
MVCDARPAAAFVGPDVIYQCRRRRRPARHGDKTVSALASRWREVIVNLLPCHVASRLFCIRISTTFLPAFSSGGDGRATKDFGFDSSNPFALPSDEKIFEFREAQRRQKEETRESLNTMPVWERAAHSAPDVPRRYFVFPAIWLHTSNPTLTPPNFYCDSMKPSEVELGGSALLRSQTAKQQTQVIFPTVCMLTWLAEYISFVKVFHMPAPVLLFDSTGTYHSRRAASRKRKSN